MSTDLPLEGKSPEQDGHEGPVPACANFNETASEPLLLDSDEETQLEQGWNRIRHYGFSTGGCNLILPAGLYSELLVQPTIAPLPNSPVHFPGLTNVRGNLVPVYRLDSWLDIDSSFSPPRFALLIDRWPRGAALVTEGKPRTLDLDDMVLLQPLATVVPELLRPAVERVYQQDGELWYLLDHLVLFAAMSGATAQDIQQPA